jgi:hypothetical protein
VADTKKVLRVDHQARVGDWIKVDDDEADHGTGALYQLMPCTDWERAAFRVQAQHFRVAVNVEVTGRKTYKAGAGESDKIRCRIIWPGDCEPDTECGGWLIRHYN